jgi:hypothetical protein
MPSTVIRSFEYAPETSVLTIRFVAGTVYEYYEVPQQVYDAFLSFREKGIFYNTHIKRKFRFMRITETKK